MTIFVPLLDEGTDVWRPVKAESLGENRFRLLDKEPDGEKWAFPSGSVVICELKSFSAGKSLVAVESIA